MKTSKTTISVILLFTIFHFIPFSSEAQSNKIEFSWEIGATLSAPKPQVEREERSQITLVRVDSVEQLKFTTYWLQNQFTAQPGAYAGLNIHFKWLKIFKLRTGIRAQFERFKYEIASNNPNLGRPLVSFIRIDFDNSPPTFGGVGNAPVFRDPDYNPNLPDAFQYNILQLRLPILLQYHTPFNIVVEGGGFLQTAIASRSKHSYNVIGSRQVPGYGISLDGNNYFGRIVEEQTPAVGLSKFHIGWQLGASYLFKKVALEVAYGQSFTNPFKAEASYQSDYYFDNNYKAVVAYTSLGLRFLL